eukprot:jgi/Tetstr1/449776/TSEL_036840.t1
MQGKAAEDTEEGVQAKGLSIHTPRDARGTGEDSSHDLQVCSEGEEDHFADADQEFFTPASSARTPSMSMHTGGGTPYFSVPPSAAPGSAFSRGLRADSDSFEDTTAGDSNCWTMTADSSDGIALRGSPVASSDGGREHSGSNGHEGQDGEEGTIEEQEESADAAYGERLGKRRRREEEEEEEKERKRGRRREHHRPVGAADLALHNVAIPSRHVQWRPQHKSFMGVVRKKRASSSGADQPSSGVLQVAKQREALAEAEPETKADVAADTKPSVPSGGLSLMKKLIREEPPGDRQVGESLTRVPPPGEPKQRSVGAAAPRPPPAARAVCGVQEQLDRVVSSVCSRVSGTEEVLLDQLRARFEEAVDGLLGNMKWEGRSIKDTWGRITFSAGLLSRCGPASRRLWQRECVQTLQSVKECTGSTTCASAVPVPLSCSCALRAAALVPGCQVSEVQDPEEATEAESFRIDIHRLGMLEGQRRAAAEHPRRRREGNGVERI